MNQQKKELKPRRQQGFEAVVSDLGYSDNKE